MLRLFSKPLSFLAWCQCVVLALALGVVAAQAETKAKPDVRVLIDVSGSMKKTDPENLRIPATKLLLNLAQPGSRMGLWTFGRYVNMLVPYGNVDKAWKEKAVREADKIGSVALFTAIGDALDQATKGQLQKDPAADRTIVLLSDGMVDISTNPADNAREQKRIFEQVVPRLVKAGFKVHTVALSEQADVDFLKRLANETGGHFSMANTADQLMNVFVKAADQVNKPTQVPMENGKFSIDGTITEFTALIYRRPGSPSAILKSPSGKRISNENHDTSVNWFNDARFDLVTIQAPEKGNWDLEGDLDPDNRVTVVSNLDVQLEGLPNDVIEGEKVTLSMYLSEKGKPIVHPQFLALMDITFSQRNDKGELFEGKLSRDRNGNAVVPPDGNYVAKLGRTLTEGEHEFSVAVDGKTFKRSKRHIMTVHKEAIATSVETELVEGHEQHYLALQPKVGLVKTETLNVLAEVVDPKGSKSVQEVTRAPTGELRVAVPPFNGDGLYQVFLKAQGTTLAGNPFDVSQGPYDIDYTPVGAAKPEVVTHEPLAGAEDLHDALDVGVEEEAVEPEADENAAEEEVAAEETPAADEEEEESKEDAPEAEVAEHDAKPFFSADNMLFLLSAFIVGNLVLFGGGGYFYMRFLRKQDDEQTRLVEQLNAIKNNTHATPAAVMPSAMAAAPAMAAMPPVVPAPASAVASVLAAAQAEVPMSSMPAFDIPSLDEDDTPTMVRSEPPPAVIPEPAAPEGPVEDRTYKIDAAPMALDDDELIELDDDVGDDELSAQLAAHAAAAQAAKAEAAPAESTAAAEPSMDELDMILAEQEALEAQLGGLDIGMPGAKPKDAAEDDKNKFADDEFMLDNPTTRS